MHCLLIDDRTALVDQLVASLQRQQEIESVHTAMHPYQIRYLLKNIPVSVVICLPHLWDHSYFEAMKSLPLVLFSTNKKAKIKEDAGRIVLNVLKDPWNEQQLKAFLLGAKDKERQRFSDFIFVRFERRWRAVAFGEIELIEKKSGSFVLIYCKHNNFLVSGNLSTWLQRLPKDRFVRPCDNLIVPVKEISRLTGDIFLFRGREIRMTFRFASLARMEMETLEL